MEPKTFDRGKPVDIDTLMARIRQAVDKRAAGTVAAPSSNGSHGLAQAQADFNLALVESLDSIAGFLKNGQGDLAVIEQRVLHEAAVQSSEIERKLGQNLQALDRVWQQLFTALQQRLDAEAERHEHAFEEMTTQIKNMHSLLVERKDRLDQQDQKLAEALGKVNEQLASLRLDQQAAAAQQEARLREQWQGMHVQLEQKISHALEEAALDRRRDQAELQSRIDAKVEQRLAEVSEHLHHDLSLLEATVKECDQACKTNLTAAVEWEQRASHELEELRIRILRSERKARALTGAQPLAEPSATATNAVPSAAPMRPTFDYFLFEHRFRGSAADIKKRQRIYLDLFRDKQAVLDVGCGRGEFVELLREQGVPVTGIDLNEDMAEYCKDRGLPVTQADVFVYLEGVADASLDGIFSAQVVEHFSVQQIQAFLRLCAAKLRPGGVVVLETINPNCPVAMNWFYLDPTHVRPVPGDLLRFLLEQELFEVEMLKFISPLAGANVPEVLDAPSRLPAAAGVYQDYAVVARKR
jgi:2-polyprenyl-3-methyl-5-hydroxy-6-metoxy-1,4-benzoquinol methylase